MATEGAWRVRTPRLMALVLAAGALVGPDVAIGQAPPGVGCIPIAKTKLRLRKLDDGVGNERLLFRGEFALDQTTAIDPAVSGLAFRMTDAGGVPFVDVALPGVVFGPLDYGWSTNGGGTAWSWRDRDGDVSGLRRVLLKRGARSNSVRVVLFGQDFEYPLPALPITIELFVPTPDGATVICARQIAQDVECFFRNQGNKLICR